ncbi:hypothetical protein GCM10028826_28390 [Mucilaginibacter boryungensis]
MLDHFFPDLHIGPGAGIQFFTLMRIAFDPFLDLTENHFHKNGLRTYPAAEDAAEGDREQYDTNQKHERGQHEEKNILRPESLAEDHKVPLHKIEQQ